jgi:PST family polysaccharide transporter
MISYRKHIRGSLVLVMANFGNFATTFLRNKLLALAFGPAGIGWIALANNLNEVFANIAGTGVCDAYNRELARAHPRFSPAQIVSTGVAISLVLLIAALPVGVWRLTSEVSMTDGRTLIILAFAGMVASATAWRLVSGLYLGLGRARRLFMPMVIGGLANLAITAVMLWAGVTQYILFALMTPLLLALIAVVPVWRELRDLIRGPLILGAPALRPMLAIALPASIACLLEPLTAYAIRAATAARFGEAGVGLIQPGLILVILGSSVFNSIVGISVVRWDQSIERAFSPRSIALLAMACALPLLAMATNFVLAPVWGLIVRLLFTRAFLPGLATVPWFVLGEALRMGSSLLGQTMQSRRLGMLYLMPRVLSIIAVLVALRLGMDATMLLIAQAYTIAFLAMFVASVVSWVGVHGWLWMRERRAAAA